jgi:hypothetical protein
MSQGTDAGRPEGAGAEGPRTLRMQPKPVETIVARMPIGGEVATAITRIWAEGDTGRCRLCARCTARLNVCTKLTDVAVPVGSGGLFSTLGREDVGVVLGLAVGYPAGG